MSWQVGLAFMAMLTCGSQAWAQVCSGAVPISSASPFSAGGSVMFADNTTGLSGIVQGGNNNVFGGLQIGRVTVDVPGDDQSSTLLGGRAGAQFTYEMDRPIHVCPVFTLSRAWASDVDDFDVSTTTFAFGADVGVLVAESGNMQVIPTAGLYFGRAGLKVDFDGEEIVDESETGGLFNVGVGLLFNQRFSVTPLISVPFGFGDETDPTFSITALYSFGRR
jgi:hypothetical protein